MITSAYAALLAFVFVYLSFRTLSMRRKLSVGIGDGGHAELQRAMRVHANFAEYTPIALILIILQEMQIGPGVSIHILGAALLIGRCLHAYGVSQMKEDLRFRVSGMVLTLIVIISSSLRLLSVAIFG